MDLLPVKQDLIYEKNGRVRRKYHTCQGIAALEAKDKFIPYVEQKRIEQKAKTKR